MALDWETLFVPQGSLVELMLRGTVMYFALLAALRVLVRRHIGSMSLMDLLLMVLIADAAQNAMAGEYHTITEGLVLCGTLVGWNWLLDWFSYKSKLVARLLEPPPLPVVRSGRMLKRNMRTELLTDEELMGLLREQGVTELKSVRLALVESDGGITIVREDGKRLSQRLQPKDKSGGGI